MPYTPTTWIDGSTQTLAAYLNNMESGIGAADPTKAINVGYGTWLNGATDSTSSTAQSTRFAATWRNGICVLHIDLLRGTSPDIVGTLSTSTPMPTVLTEVQTEQSSGGYVWVNANSRNVYAQGNTSRYDTMLTWLY